MMSNNSLGTTKIVEFFGLPRTGKSITVTALNKYLREIGVTSETVIERASICPIKNKLHPLFNFWTTNALMKEYIEACDRGVEILLADRGVLDATVWMHFKNRNEQYQSEFEYFKSLLNMRFINDNILVAYYFDTDIDLILKREYKRRVGKKTGRVMNRPVLQGYSSCYESIKSDLAKIARIVQIDTSNIGIEEMVKTVCEDFTSNYLKQIRKHLVSNF